MRTPSPSLPPYPGPVLDERSGERPRALPGWTRDLPAWAWPSWHWKRTMLWLRLAFAIFAALLVVLAHGPGERWGLLAAFLVFAPLAVLGMLAAGWAACYHVAVRSAADAVWVTGWPEDLTADLARAWAALLRVATEASVIGLLGGGCLAGTLGALHLGVRPFATTWGFALSQFGGALALLGFVVTDVHVMDAGAQAASSFAFQRACLAGAVLARRGGRFRVAWQRAVERSEQVALDVLLLADEAQRAVLPPGAMTALVCSSQPAVRATAAAVLPWVGVAAQRSPLPSTPGFPLSCRC